MPESPGEAELLERVLDEDPAHRAARRAYERWLKFARLQAAIERAQLNGDEERIRFLFASLWPSTSPAFVDKFVRQTLRESGSAFHVPAQIDELLDPVEINLLASFGLLPTTVPSTDS